MWQVVEAATLDQEGPLDYGTWHRELKLHPPVRREFTLGSDMRVFLKTRAPVVGLSLYGHCYLESSWVSYFVNLRTLGTM